MDYRDFFDQIRDNIKDVDTEASASIPSAELGRYILKSVRKIQSMFPETRMDRRGSLKALETTAYTETTADVMTNGQYPAIPLPEEFEPVLEAAVMTCVYGRDSNDVKDESLFRHWQNRYDQLTGATAPRR